MRPITPGRGTGKLPPRVKRRKKEETTGSPLLAHTGFRGPEYIMVPSRTPKKYMFRPMRESYPHPKRRTRRARRGPRVKISRYGRYGPVFYSEKAFENLRLFYEYKARAAKYQKRKSEIFYEALGYPEYAGKYKPFEIPEGKRVESIKKTDKGLDVTFTEAQKGLAQSILDLKLPSLNLAPTSEFMKPIVPKKHPERFFAGAIAGFESLIYGVGRLAGFETPSAPSTLTAEHGWEYMMGVGWSTLLMSEVLGGIDKRIGSPLARTEQKIIGRVAKTRIGQKIGGAFRRHAPRKVLRAVYGPKMGEAIHIERTFGSWKWGPGEMAKATKAYGSAAAKSGVPFYRGETLHYAVPTKEWAHLRFLQRIAGYKELTKKWTWTSPVFGKSGFTQKLSRESVRGAESLYGPTPVKAKPEKFYFQIRGTPQTPMDVTLRKAMMDEGLLAAPTQRAILIHKPITTTTPSPKTFLKAPTRLFVEPSKSQPIIYKGVSQLVFQQKQVFPYLISAFLPLTKLTKKIKSPTKAVTIETPAIVQATKDITQTVTTPIQHPITTPRQRQRLDIPIKLDFGFPDTPFSPPHTPVTGTPPPPPVPPLTPDFPRLKAKRGKKKLKLFDERWFKKQHPLATGKQLEKLLGR